jgi:hypothetical protein
MLCSERCYASMESVAAGEAALKEALGFLAATKNASVGMEDLSSRVFHKQSKATGEVVLGDPVFFEKMGVQIACVARLLDFEASIEAPIGILVENTTSVLVFGKGLPAFRGF